MKKTLAHIALAVLLLTPVLTSVSAALSLGHADLAAAAQLPFSGDLEDQGSDTDPRDTEVDMDTDILLERISLFQARITFRETPSGAEHVFSDHKCEVGTPPPKS